MFSIHFFDTRIKEIAILAAYFKLSEKTKKQLILIQYVSYLYLVMLIS